MNEVSKARSTGQLIDEAVALGGGQGAHALGAVRVVVDPDDWTSAQSLARLAGILIIDERCDVDSCLLRDGEEFLREHAGS